MTETERVAALPREGDVVVLRGDLRWSFLRMAGGDRTPIAQFVRSLPPHERGIAYGLPHLMWSDVVQFGSERVIPKEAT